MHVGILQQAQFLTCGLLSFCRYMRIAEVFILPSLAWWETSWRDKSPVHEVSHQGATGRPNFTHLKTTNTAGPELIR
ncbi:hypothetical protein SAMN05216386_1544 [Nitrosospira briensis]|uniref:Uncharacterized protein n=1 Tax=Nitrosospira briensis TaxID=35799 RepID=A0A1I5AUW1_9PROT|nr:hypothetical protein SAMN05216386_1544 [Nitrosospira briensis]